MERGYIKLYRCLQDNELWKQKPFTKGQAWVDLLLLTNHKDGGYWLRGIYIKVLRGQCGWSQVKLAERWGWSRDKVRRFIKYLKNESQVAHETIQQNEYLSSLITIINYEQYQGSDTTDDTATRQQTDSKQVSNKKDKKDKKIKHKYGEYKNVLLTDDEKEKLIKVYGRNETLKKIEALSGHIGSTGKIYKSHFITIRNWFNKEGTKAKRICEPQNPMPANTPDKTDWAHPDLKTLREQRDGKFTGKTAKECLNCGIRFEH